VAGQTAMNADGQIVGVGDVAAQFEQALANVRTALDAAGGAPDDLASLTIYAVDLADYRVHAREIGAVWRTMIGTDNRVETKGLEPSTPALQNRCEASAYVRVRPPTPQIGRNRSQSNAISRSVDSKLGSKLRRLPRYHQRGPQRGR